MLGLWMYFDCFVFSLFWFFVLFFALFCSCFFFFFFCFLFFLFFVCLFVLFLLVFVFVSSFLCFLFLFLFCFLSSPSGCWWYQSWWEESELGNAVLFDVGLEWYLVFIFLEHCFNMLKNCMWKSWLILDHQKSYMYLYIFVCLFVFW